MAETLLNSSLKAEHVRDLLDWSKTEPHVPEISETQAIMFLKKWNYDVEATKDAIDAYFTMKSSDVFAGISPSNPAVVKSLDVILFTVLPKKTPEGYVIIFLKALDTDVSKWDLSVLIKNFLLVTALSLHEEESAEGYIFAMDAEGIPEAFLPQFDHDVFKSFFNLVEDVMPWDVKGWHYFNGPPYMDVIAAKIKRQMNKFAEILAVHDTVDDFVKTVPRKCLPKDYGGEVESVAVLHENIKKKVLDNAEFFDWLDKQRVDESKRQGKCPITNASY